MNTAERTRLRILYHHRTAASDGMRVHIDELVHALRARGHIVRVVGPATAHSQERNRGPSRLERMADLLRSLLPAVVFELLELLYNAPAYIRLAREANAFMPDVLYERYNLFLLAGLYLSRRRNLPKILEVNSPLAAERASHGNLRLKSLARRCEAMLWREAAAVLPVSRVLAQYVSDVRETDRGVFVVPNGANLEAEPDMQKMAAIRKYYGLTNEHVVIGFVGFVRAWHGVGWALEALIELPPHIHLFVVGDGPARPQLEYEAQSLGVADRVHFSGRVSHEDVSAHVATFDIALQTAAVAYASPLKLFEYMALRRAIIAPNQPNIREILTHEQNALLFRPADRNSFKAAVRKLCLDGKLRARLGAAARKTVEDTPLTWAHNASRIEALARQLLTDGPTDGATVRDTAAAAAERH